MISRPQQQELDIPVSCIRKTKGGEQPLTNSANASHLANCLMSWPFHIYLDKKEEGKSGTSLED